MVVKYVREMSESSPLHVRGRVRDGLCGHVRGRVEGDTDECAPSPNIKLFYSFFL